MDNKELLIRIKVEKDDNFIDFYRDPETHKISLCSKEHCAVLPDLTGMETTDLFSLLEPLGDKLEFPDDAETDEQLLKEGEVNEPAENQ